jgi:hypothetical protein
VRRALSPALLRAGALASGTTLRLDIHPSDLHRTNHMLALEWVLRRAARDRDAVTYDELAISAPLQLAPPALSPRSRTETTLQAP